MRSSQIGRLLITLLILIAVLPVQPTFAQTLSEDAPLGDDAATGMAQMQDGFGPLLFKTILSLVLIIGLIWLGVWALKRFFYSKREGGTVSMRVVSTMTLGAKKNLSLVEIRGRFLLLGVTESAISFLTELDDIPETEFPRAGSFKGSPAQGGQTFRDLLNVLVGKSKDASEKSES